MPSNFITWLIVLTVSFFLIIFSVNKTLPFQKRAEFLNLCDQYNQIAIKQGYLKGTDITELTAALSAKGISVSVLTVPQVKLEWGTTFNLKVEGVYNQGELQVNYSKSPRSYSFSYEKKSTTLCEE